MTPAFNSAEYLCTFCGDAIYIADFVIAMYDATHYILHHDMTQMLVDILCYVVVNKLTETQTDKHLQQAMAGQSTISNKLRQTERAEMVFRDNCEE